MLAQLMDIGKLVLGKKVPKVAVHNNETIRGTKALTPKTTELQWTTCERKKHQQQQQQQQQQPMNSWRHRCMAISCIEVYLLKFYD